MCAFRNNILPLQKRIICTIHVEAAYAVAQLVEALHYKLEGRGFDCPSGLMRWSVADRLLGLRVRIPTGIWMFVFYVVRKDKRQNSVQLSQRNKYG
jgi:hypothetical protein